MAKNIVNHMDEYMDNTGGFKKITYKVVGKGVQKIKLKLGEVKKGKRSSKKPKGK